MYFLFILTSMLGGLLAGRGYNEGDAGIGIFGVLVIVVSCIACGVIGFPS